MTKLLTFAAEEGGHARIAAGDGGFWGDTAWIMLVLPFVAFLAILAFGKRLKHQGGEIAVAALAINLVWADGAVRPQHDRGGPRHHPHLRDRPHRERPGVRVGMGPRRSRR